MVGDTLAGPLDGAGNFVLRLAILVQLDDSLA
jgi:hypothetical protein